MKDSPGAWIALIGGLFVMQTWIVPTVINAVTSSTLMKGIPEEGGSNLPVSNEQTHWAFIHCNRYLASREPSAELTFAPAPEKSWDMGFGRYLVHAAMQRGNGEPSAPLRAYLCRIRFAGGNAEEAGNWTVEGIEFRTP